MPIFLKFKAALDDSAFMAGMRRIQTAAGRMGRGIGRGANAIGGFGLRGGAIGAIAAGAGARAIMRDADALYNLSRKTGMAATSLAALAEMGKGANLEMEQLAQAAAMMSNNLGTAKGQKAIVDMGLSLEEIQKLKPEEQFFKIGKAIGQIGDQTQKVGASRAIFGRRAADMFELFDDIEKLDMSKVSENAKLMGDAAKDISDFADKIAHAGVTAKSWGAKLIQDLLRGDWSLFNGPAHTGLGFNPGEKGIAPAGRPDPFAGFTTANKTPSLAFRHLKDKGQWWNNRGGQILRSAVPGTNQVFGSSLETSGGLTTGGLQPSEGLGGAAHGVVRRGDRQRARAHERMIQQELKEAIKRRELLEEIRERLEAMGETLDDE